MNQLQAIFELPSRARMAALDGWLNSQPDADAAARLLAGALAALDEQQRADVLNAEKLRFPLGDAAERSSDPVIQSELLVHASTSAFITLELADLPYSYARQALQANPANEAAWAALVESLQSDFTDFLEDLEGWVAQAKRGEVPAELVKRTIAGARRIAKDNLWSASEVERLEKSASALTS